MDYVMRNLGIDEKELENAEDIDIEWYGGIEFLQEAEKDMKRLDHSVQIQVMKIIVISARTDEQIYKEASKRRKEHNI